MNNINQKNKIQLTQIKNLYDSTDRIQMFYIYIAKRMLIYTVKRLTFYTIKRIFGEVSFYVRLRF